MEAGTRKRGFGRPGADSQTRRAMTIDLCQKEGGRQATTTVQRLETGKCGLAWHLAYLLRVRRGGLGSRNGQELRQLDGELLEIGPLAASRGRPAGNEIIDAQDRSCLFRDTQADFRRLFHGLSLSLSF